MKIDWHPEMSRLRSALADQLAAPLEVSKEGRQYYFDEDSAAYSEIEVRNGEVFVVVIVRGGLPDPSAEFIVRCWHRHTEEVWLVDSTEQAVFVVPRDGAIRGFALGDVLSSSCLPEVRIPIAMLFDVSN